MDKRKKKKMENSVKGKTSKDNKYERVLCRDTDLYKTNNKKRNSKHTKFL